MDASLLYQCRTKATTAKGDQQRRGPSWVLAKRAQLRIYADRAECGEWTIANDEIRSATLTSFKTMLVIPGFILTIVTDDATYHFGLNGARFWAGELPFAVKREAGELGYSAFSAILRIVLLASVAYLLWSWLSGS